MQETEHVPTGRLLAAPYAFQCPVATIIKIEGDAVNYPPVSRVMGFLAFVGTAAAKSKMHTFVLGVCSVRVLP